MIKIRFACLKKLDSSCKGEDENCIFNSQGESPRCEYFDDEDEQDISEYFEYLLTGTLENVCEE